MSSCTEIFILFLKINFSFFKVAFILIMYVSLRLVLLFGRFLHEIFAHVIIIGGRGRGGCVA